MFLKHAIYVLPYLLQFAVAQSGYVGPFPVQQCSSLSGATCPGTSGCCGIGGTCCGSGCCGLQGVCINSGTSKATCCDITDPSLCGTRATTTAPPAPGATVCSGGGITNCFSSGDHWVCLFGQTCGVYSGSCYGGIGNKCSVVPGATSSEVKPVAASTSTQKGSSVSALAPSSSSSPALGGSGFGSQSTSSSPSPASGAQSQLLSSAGRTWKLAVEILLSLGFGLLA